METVNTDIPLHREPGVEWSVVVRPSPGEDISGDHYAVVARPGRLLLAAVDGLGHGAEATQAARRAVDELLAHPEDAVVRLVQRCHEALTSTRGAAMTVVSIDLHQRVATALGIGNVEAVLVRARGVEPARQRVLLRGGVVGYRLPALQPCVFPIAPEDVVVFATDGVREEFGDRLTADEPLPRLVEGILERGRRGTDDALVLACKLLGAP